MNTEDISKWWIEEMSYKSTPVSTTLIKEINNKPRIFTTWIQEMNDKPRIYTTWIQEMNKKTRYPLHRYRR